MALQSKTMTMMLTRRSNSTKSSRTRNSEIAKEKRKRSKRRNWTSLHLALRVKDSCQRLCQRSKRQLRV